MRHRPAQARCGGHAVASSSLPRSNGCHEVRPSEIAPLLDSNVDRPTSGTIALPIEVGITDTADPVVAEAVERDSVAIGCIPFDAT